VFCYYDIETRSRNPISWGTDVYFERAELLIASFARDDGPGQLWDAIGGEPRPRDLEDAIRDPSCVFVAHHAAFDRGGSRRLAGVDVPVERWRCTMAQAASHGYPASLEGVGAALELPEDLRKFETGKGLIQLFCVPYDDPGNYYDRYTHPGKWDDFCEYGLQDGVTLREIHRRLPKVNYEGENLQTWWIDQLINERGFGFDQDLAVAARKLLDSQRGRHERDMLERTENQVESATQRAKLLAYFESKGLALPNMRASTISEWLEHDDLSPEIRYLLEARLEAAKNSGAKYRRGLEMVGEGSRIRYGIRFSGAGRTGRFSGKGFQPHNMMRPTTYVTKPDGTRSKKPVKSDFILDILVPGIKAGKVLDNEAIYGGPNEACANALRCAIVAAPGNELVVADWSNIESRVLAWIAGETWKLDAYRAVDAGTGVDLYKLLFSQFFGKSVDDIDDNERQSGKVSELAFGFGGGVGALVTMAAVYEMDLDALSAPVWSTATEEQRKKAQRAWKRAFLEGEDYDLDPRTYKACDILKQAYRKSNKAINDLRHALDDATKTAIKQPGTVFDVAKCRIWATSSFLIIQLPSGRRLLYAKPRIEEEAHFDFEEGKEKYREYISYLTARGKGWIRERAWSGLFIENIVQAVANDVLRAGLRAVHRDTWAIPAIRTYLELIEGAATAISLHVHDEVVLDVPCGTYPVSSLVAALTTELIEANYWMRGLPLAAKGWCGPTYKKD
jgi:DNA polymerase bacteriophage-type